MEYLIWGIILLTSGSLFFAIKKILENKPFDDVLWAAILAGVLISTSYFFAEELGMWFTVIHGIGVLAIILWFVDKYFFKIFKRNQ